MDKVTEAPIISDTALLDKRRMLFGLEDLQPEALKVLFLMADGEGCAWYRGKQPANAINTNFPKEVNQVCSHVWHVSDHTPQDGDPLWDIVVHQRQASDANKNFAATMREVRNVKNVYEIDDDIFHLDPKSAFAPFYTKDKVSKMMTIMRGCDAVTVTTEPLKRLYSSYHDNIHVLPNAVDVDMIRSIVPMMKLPTEITIGWSGSASHWVDLEFIIPAIKEILNKYPDVVFQVGGWIDCPLLDDLPSAQLRKLPWTSDMGDYFKMMKSVDIGLCPLADIKFNEGKSNLRVIEYGAAGVPVIASEVVPYAGVVKDKKTGILIKTSGALHRRWLKAMEAMINDKKLRKTLAMNLHNTVRDKYDQNKIAAKWKDFYLNLGVRT